MVPGYAIIGMLGAGGMGQVYLAQSADYGRVALKVVFATPDSALASRFRREAKALVDLGVDGVVRGLDWGQDDQLLWLAMEWVRGPSLAAVLEGGRALEPSEAVRIAVEVARSLSRVHRAGLAHRDIKPSNILLQPDGTPLLADFGILRHLDDTPHTALTQRPIGTPAYMAPELLKTDDVDWVRADLYALGVVLARSLLGRVPHGDWDLEGLDPRWHSILTACLSTRPSDRPESGDALASALESARRERWGGRPLRLSRWQVLAAGMGVVTVVAAGAWLSMPTDSRDAVAAEAFEPVEALYEAQRTEAAERVFARVLDAQPAAIDERLWLARAAVVDDAEAWAEAWEHATGVRRQTARHGLQRALLDARDFDALDVLLAGDDDPDPEVHAANTIFHRRLAAVQDGSVDVPAPNRPILDALSRIRPVKDPEDTARALGWPATGPGSLVDFDAPVQILQHHPSLARVDDRLQDFATGRSCPIGVPSFHWAQWWEGRVAMITSGEDRSVYLLDMDTCAFEVHPAVATLDNSYVNAVTSWDMDGDGTDELVFLVGPPYGYELVVVDAKEVKTRLTLGNVVGATVLPTEQSTNGSDLIVRVDPPHANGEVFDLQPEGVYRLRWTGDALETVQFFEGYWPFLWSVDLVPDAPPVLVLGDWDGMGLHVPDDPDVAPIWMSGLDWHAPGADLDGDGDDELVVRKGQDWFVVGMAEEGMSGADLLAMPVPELRPTSGDPAIDRARRLERLGLRELAAERLTLASLGRTGTDARQAWTEVARLRTDAGDVEQAADAWLEATKAGHPAARREALSLLARVGVLDKADALIRDAPAGSLDEHIVKALQTRIDEGFDRAPRGWALRTPLATWSADRGLLRLRSLGPAGVLARLPLAEAVESPEEREDDGGGAAPLGFDVRLQIDRLEFGAQLRIRLVSAEGIAGEAVVRAQGGRGDIDRNVAPHPWPEHAWDGDDPAIKDEVRVTFASLGSERWFTVVRNGSLLYRHPMPDHDALPVVALEIDSVGIDGALLDVSLEHLSIWGVERGPPQPLPPADDEARAAIRRTALRTGSGLARLEPDDPERLLDLMVATDLSWRMHRSASGLQDRVLSIPGIDDPAVLDQAPLLALDRAEMLLAVGDPAAALEALEPLVDSEAVSCVRVRAAQWAAHRALNDPAGERAARDAANACGAGEKAVATALWWAGGPREP